MKLGLLRLWIIPYGTVTVTVYGYRSDTAVYGYFLTLVNTVNTVHFCKVTVFTVFSVYFCLRLCTVMYGYRGIYGIYGIFGVFLPTVMYAYVRLCTVTAVIAVKTVHNRKLRLLTL